ncbi:MAG: hypothetical protein NZM13_02010 [Cyclobacteriaceae bacterium]|nr:hypothetical protein [Cyclobacteriaceae bacterium]MDW8330714.1 hypothetical protein [Cyclobacteriaceae bacterium]
MKNLAVFLIIILIASCSTKENTNTTTSSQAGKTEQQNMITFDYKGKTILAPIHNASWVEDENMPVFNITAFFGDEGTSLYKQPQIAFNIHHLKPETTTVPKLKNLKDKETSGYMTITEFAADGKQVYYTTYLPEATFVVNITAHDLQNRYIEGTFAAVLFDDNGVKAEVTNGKFSSYYQVVTTSYK